MALELTASRRRFAHLVAQGNKYVDAYEVAFPNNKAPRRNKADSASLLANLPEVRAAIREYELQVMPTLDLRRLREEQMANIRYLATYSPDHKVRLAAAVKLVEFSERYENADSVRKRTLTIDNLVAEIAQIAAPEPEPTIELESEAEPEAQIQDENDATVDAGSGITTNVKAR